MSHSHEHSHGREAGRRRLAWTLGLVLLYMTAEGRICHLAQFLVRIRPRRPEMAPGWWAC